MPVKVGKFLEKIAKKAGQDTSVEAFKTLLELDMDIPDEIAASLDKNLLNIEDAKKHTDVNKALRQSILGAADLKMEEVLKEIKVQPDDTFINEHNTYEKIPMLAKMIYDAGQKKATADNQVGVHETLKKEKEAFAAKEADYQKQFGDFQAKLKAAQDQFEAREKTYNDSLESNSINYDLYKKLLGKNYVLPEKMDPDLKVETALVTIKNELGKKGLSIKRGEGRELGLFDKEGNPGYSADHNLLKLDDFLDGVLAQNNLLKINDSDNKNSGQSGAQDIPGANKNGNSAIMAEIDQQIKEFSQA